MVVRLDPALVPKNGRTLKVLSIGRVSKPKNKPAADQGHPVEKELSLADQEALYRNYLKETCDYPVDLICLAGTGSGELLDRKESGQAEELVERGDLDLVLTEDLARIFRRVHAFLFCELCEDHDTRLISLNDHVDTGRPEWRLNAFFSTMRHEIYNKDTANRIRRSLRNRFMQGGIVQQVIPGYIKPPGAKKEDDLRKDSAAELIYQEWFRRLEDGATYQEIADWLNGQGFATGPFARNKKWDGPMVARVTHNPILKGLRVRNDKIARRINKTGHRRSVKAPASERLERHCPHLAFFDPRYYDRVIRKVDLRNAKYKRSGVNGVDTRLNVPKKRTLWPGQHLRCGICGRLYYWTGAADKKHMMCSGSLNYQCWNSVALNGTEAADKLAAAIWNEIMALPGFDPCLVETVNAKWKAALAARNQQQHDKARRRQENADQIAKVTDAIAQLGGSQALLAKLHALENERDALDEETEPAEDVAGNIALPSLATIKNRAGEIFTEFAAADPEVGRLLHWLIPDLRVYPYRRCDDGAVVLKAKFTLHLAALMPGKGKVNGYGGLLDRPMSVDLFQKPKPVRYREQVMVMRGQGIPERQIARKLGIAKTEVQRAAALDRHMKKLGMTDPYQPLTEPPAGYGKLRRHAHPRYRFEPLAQPAASA